jgi:hypothetical protein
MQQHRLPAEIAPARADAWYRQPVLWLGAAIFVASLAGCIATIVVSTRHVDAPVQDVHPHTLLDMPVHGAGSGEQETRNVAGAEALPSQGTAGTAVNSEGAEALPSRDTAGAEGNTP